MNIIVVAPTQEEADGLAAQLVSDRQVLVLDALGGTENLASVLAAWRPDVVVVHRVLAEEVRGMKPGKPLLVYDEKATPEEIIRVLLSPPEPPPSEPAAPPARLPPRPPVVLGFQGAYGGAGTTTVLCAVAVAASRSDMRVLVLDVGDDCAITLSPDVSYGTEHVIYGITVLGRVPDRPQIDALLPAYDLVLVDAGTVRGRPGLVRFLLNQYGAMFYLVVDARRKTDLSIPGYGTILNAVSGGAPWWQKVDAQFPFVAGLTTRINAGRFTEPSPFLQAAEIFLRGVVC
jgi:hypothetical protein